MVTLSLPAALLYPFTEAYLLIWASQAALVVKNLPASAGDIRDVSSIPGSGRSPREGHGNPLQHSSLENPMDKEAWWATVHRVTKSRTRLSDFTSFLQYIVLYLKKWPKHLNGKFTNGATQNINKNMERCSTSLRISESK